MSRPGTGEREEGNIIPGPHSASAACQVSSATSSACQSSHGVRRAAKLHRVYTKTSYVCLNWRCGGEKEVRCTCAVAIPGTGQEETCPPGPLQTNRRTYQQKLYLLRQKVKSDLTTEDSLWLIDVWPWSRSFNDAFLCQRGRLLKLDHPSLLH